MPNDNRIRWEEPPELPARQRTPGPRHDAQLRQFPKRWARIRDYLDKAYTESPTRMLASSYAWTIRTGNISWAEPAGSFEAIHRPIKGGWAVYARYVGQDGAK